LKKKNPGHFPEIMEVYAAIEKAGETKSYF